jgi:ABC-type bacteriocin/lantibiotic exporter with double-glycine peptidase domain
MPPIDSNIIRSILLVVVVPLIFSPWSLLVWLAVEVFGAMYIVSFVWFWQLCRSSARREMTHVRKQASSSNLIPFERGLQQLRKRSTPF